MYSRYHFGYLLDYNTPTKIPATVAPAETEMPSKFLPMDGKGEEYFETSTSPVVLQLEKSRRNLDKGAISPKVHLNTALTLFSELDLPLHRKASALLRYLSADVLENLAKSSDASNVFSKFGCYYQAHDWVALMKVLQNEKDFLLTSSSVSGYTNNENQYYTDPQLVLTPDSDRKPPVGSPSTSQSQTPVHKRKRTRKPASEIPVCPSLTNL
ncbi:hypothetical protein B0I72DRAFT_165193 [Yarrowia lipolytica]|uniref:YALI0A17556p n=2 Tax=Yarrowia lipolytica TaxID=4952 RepID=Q6CGP3_YARLI|nr:YALI0A17556p [Yarrowia lipolytica CLIB122]QNP95266.1 Hypothetical protein YALI2_A00265g [Yarrowia lipolytica]RDW24985.1 hypothetical protein B0I71DRAFT_171384 [Yarrowia lipolytica]RDW31725.1 hypothetical protein B0I72DRAFT_165193 [Yarrowia lipolytica]RDW38595.1 hypothetical protein B0I73DRAFT_165616 [Yarrowia lipolytica]RDW43880.1 hypothetical protein B0I74DRAFT_161653 [Yarrowia lipolytica]|eukprot:XP_500169.1 YALI0A17556p [Yarrowia lipolytica CLIB122]